MRVSLTLLLALVLWLLAGAAHATSPCPAVAISNCGHRGGGNTSADNPVPENTIESVLAAEAAGADFVEVDVMHSVDGVLVVIHDDTVDRTTDGVGCVGSMTLAELQTLDAATGTDLEGTGVVIPSLAELLDATNAHVNVEIKAITDDGCPVPDRTALALDVLAMVDEHGRDGRQVVVSSFDPLVLNRLRTESEDVVLGFISSNPGIVDTAESAGFDAVNLRHTDVDDFIVADAHARGLAVNVWTVDGEEDLRRMIDLGVDQVITNRVADFAASKLAWCAEAGLSPDCEEDPPVGDVDDDEGCACTASLAPSSDPAGLALLATLLAAAPRRRRSR
jgi:glycerophosphoryl diester phosphodiesterase